MDIEDEEISHEIGNLLAIIKSNAQFCLKYYSVNKELRESLKAVIDSVNFANEFIEKPITLTNAKHQSKPTQINEIIKKAINLLRTELDHKGIKVSFKKINRIPKSNVDNVKLEQVFVNLLINSEHALSKDGTISIISLFDRKTNNIVIHLQDSGKGIPQKYIKNVFAPFFSLSKKGKGLGLAICQKIINSHGGKMFAENIKKKGTRITIQLPLQKSPS